MALSHTEKIFGHSWKQPLQTFTNSAATIQAPKEGRQKSRFSRRLAFIEQGTGDVASYSCVVRSACLGHLHFAGDSTMIFNPTEVPAYKDGPLGGDTTNNGGASLSNYGVPW